jgi:hypothetical protein
MSFLSSPVVVFPSTHCQVYNGQFVNDQFEGVGELTYSDGSVYQVHLSSVIFSLLLFYAFCIFWIQ